MHTDLRTLIGLISCTNYETLCSIVASHPPFDDWFFKYNPTNHNMSVLKTVENNPSTVYADTTLVTEKPYLSLPLQEGKYTHSGTVQTTVYDNSGNGNNGTISNITTGGSWNDDNTLTNNGGSALSIDLPSISALNTLTEFTVSFWYNPLDELIPTQTRYLVTKGVGIAQSIAIYRNASVNDLRFAVFETSGSDFQAITFPNAFPNANEWYFVICKWKSGEKAKISVNNAPYLESTNIKTFTLTNAVNNVKLFRSPNGAKGIIALFKMWNTQISDSKQTDLYYEGYHNPLFPKSENIQPSVEEDPEDIFIPFSNVYTLDKMTTPVLADYRRLNSLAGDNPLIQRYNVADGTSAVDPEVLKYNVPDGVTTGGGAIPFTAEYTLAIPGSNNSSVRLTDSEDNDAAGIEVDTGSTLIGKKITKATFYLKGVNSPTGNIFCRIWNASDVVVATLGYNGTAGAGLNSATVNTSTHTAYSFWDVTSTYGNMAVGWKVGLEYVGTSSDEIQVRRDSDAPKANEIQASRSKDDGDWSSNDDYDVCGILYSGGTGSPSVDPWIELGTGTFTTVTEIFGATAHNLLNQIPRKVTLRLKKTGTPTGTFTVAVMNGAVHR